MLAVLRDVFSALNKNELKYIIYKGLSHLDEDLDAQRGMDGDIDILVPFNEMDHLYAIMKIFNVHRGIDEREKDSCIVYDEDTTKVVFLDFDTKIKFGQRPYKPSYLKILVNSLEAIEYKNLKILGNKDYIPLMFIMRISMPHPKQDNLLELQTLLVKEKEANNGYVVEVLERLIEGDWRDVKNDILHAQDWKSLQYKYQALILQKSKVDIYLLYKQKAQRVLSLLRRVQKKIYKTPRFRIRKKGHLLAFIGVDGAGKSSTIDFILSLDYFKYTGIKRVYFGNNEYWIPGVVWGLNNAQNRWLKMFFSILAHIDRSLRSVIVLSLIYRGYNVVADRYYYDDFVGYEMKKKNIIPTRSIFKRFYRKIFEPRVLVRPNKTFFLNVSPEVAYQRKQDYSFEMMLEVNQAYKAFMPKVENVVIIDADKSQENIRKEVISHILNLDKV